MAQPLLTCEPSFDPKRRTRRYSEPLYCLGHILVRGRGESDPEVHIR